MTGRDRQDGPVRAIRFDTMSGNRNTEPDAPPAGDGTAEPDPAVAETPKAKEIGGRKGPDPTRYGDWERNGRCVDF